MKVWRRTAKLSNVQTNTVFPSMSVAMEAWHMKKRYAISELVWTPVSPRTMVHLEANRDHLSGEISDRQFAGLYSHQWKVRTRDLLGLVRTEECSCEYDLTLPNFIVIILTLILLSMNILI